MGEKVKSKKGLIIGIIAAAVVVIAAVVCLIIFLVKDTSVPKNLEDLRTAMVNKDAINCTVTDPDQGEVTIQANKNWTSVRMTMKGVNMLFIDGDALYYWGENSAYKMTYDSSLLNGFTSGIKDAEITKEDEEVVFTCSKPDGADLKVPTGIEFTDLSALTE
ncbi:hypothetical protein FWC31_02790 [Candidatus Saccharibacteria bacterium]|nr:hypothetical protein [Candidatus Saccharibacteria bacterium]